VSEQCAQWSFRDALPEPLLKEKPPFGVSSVRGTIYEDYRTPHEYELSYHHQNKTKTLNEYHDRRIAEEARKNEELKHQRRALTLAKFRNRRLVNAETERRISYPAKRRTPIIFTANADTPYNPTLNDIDIYTQTSENIERLAEPRQSPMHKNLRNFYHWRNQLNLARMRPQSGYSHSARTLDGYYSGRPISAVSKEGCSFEEEGKEGCSIIPTKQHLINKMHEEREMVFSSTAALRIPEEAKEAMSSIDEFERTLEKLREHER